MATWQEMATAQARRLVDKFGRDFIWTPQAGAPVTVKGIFDHNYMDDTGGFGIQTYSASVQVVADDVEGIAAGDTWTDGAVDYTVKQLEPDGEGIVNILLRR